jgi:predicted TIM-barrel fold metal-dependent hydrolase
MAPPSLSFCLLLRYEVRALPDRRKLPASGHSNTPNPSLVSAVDAMDRSHTPPRWPLPPGACDCHMHIFGPASRFPYATRRPYTPPDAILKDYRRVQGITGLSRFVLVQPSVYGADNACLLDALAQANGAARGVAGLDATTPPSALDAWHQAGVRGVRVNLTSVGAADPAAASRDLLAAGERIGPLGWHVQVHAGLALLARLHEVIERLLARGVPVVVDHLALALDADGRPNAALPWLEDLLKSGTLWLKASALYRVSRQAPPHADAVGLARRLIGLAPRRIVWGSDWPNTGSHGGLAEAGQGPAILPFRPIDAGASLNLLAEAAPDTDARRRVLADNPAELYGFPPVT